ncbi:MAG: hypothetical protein ACP5QK_01145 [Myxococcota bacterium]
MLADIYTSILLGLSFSNIWICALVIFSLQTSDRLTGIAYIIGRFLGIVTFVAIFHIIGDTFRPSHITLDIISGISVLLFGGYFIYKYSTLSRAEVSHHKSHIEFKNSCEHNCDNCIISKKPEIYKYCESCTDDKKSCSSEDVQIEPLTREARRLWGKDSKGLQRTGLFFGLFLGVVRGSAMCGRLVVLLPLAIKGTLFSAMLIGSVFAISSTIYPLMAMLLGEYMLKVVRYRKVVIITNSILLLIISGYYFNHALNLFHL